jgi:hypothetical protein
MKKSILLLAISTFCLSQYSCENTKNANPKNEENVKTYSDDKFVGKWINRDGYYTQHVDIRKEKNLYIIDNYTTGNKGERGQYSKIFSGKLIDGSIEVNIAEVRRIDLSEQTNKLYAAGFEYEKE